MEAAQRPEDDELARTLGQRVRELRRAQSLTLKDLGARAGLSHAFLSQFERGLSTASVVTLRRLSEALGTTISALLATPAAEQVNVKRVDEGTQVSVNDVPDGSVLRSLARADFPVQPVEYTGGPREFGAYFEHAGHEMLYVVSGTIEADFGDGHRERLGPRDTVSYPGTLAHRWRVTGRREVRVLLILSTH